MSINQLNNSEDDMPEIPCNYYETEELTNLMNEEDKLIIFHLNIRSFNKNYDSLSLMLNNINRKIDVIVLTETWFIEGMCGSIEGYVGHHSVRRSKMGGGVSVYIRCGLTSIKLPDTSTVEECGEICTVELRPDPNISSQRIIIMGAYRPPNEPIAPFTDLVRNLMSKFPNKPILLTGDFNIDLLNDERNSDILNPMLEYNFHPLINIATRITENSGKCIDHIWYNRFNVETSGAIISDISDHYPIFTVLGVKNDKGLIKKTFRDQSVLHIENLSDEVLGMRE